MITYMLTLLNQELDESILVTSLTTTSYTGLTTGITTGTDHILHWTMDHMLELDHMLDHIQYYILD